MTLKITNLKIGSVKQNNVILIQNFLGKKAY